MTAPDLHRYVRLRRTAGLTPVTAEQASRALPGSWAACRAIKINSGGTVGRVA